VFDFARAEIERRAGSLQQGEAPTRSDSAPVELAAEAPAFAAAAVPRRVHGLEVTRNERSGLELAWSLSPDDVHRARDLIDGEAVLCVRVVAFSALRDDVMREVQDRPGVELDGACEVGRVDGRAIVSIGLRAGERFASIAHHVL
jgi:hypothetical protein